MPDAKDILKEKQVEYILKSNEYKEIIKEMTENIISNCKKSANEASTVSIFELELYGFIRESLGLKYYPEKESPVETVRHRAKGRIDSKIGGLITEYKYHEKFDNNEKIEKATSQIQDYLDGLYKLNDEVDYLGVITDGITIRFVRLEKGVFIKESIKALEYSDVDRLIKSIVTLQKVELNSKNLVEDFKLSDDKLSKSLSIELYEALTSNKCDKTNMLFSEWKELFKLSHDDKSKQTAIKERKLALQEALNKKFKEDTDEEYMAMFSIQTTYAIILKIIAFRVISNIYFNKSTDDNFYALATADNEALKLKMQTLEEGDFFKDLGFLNLLEGDFFSWYSSDEQWNENIAENIKKIFSILSKYEDKTIFTQNDNVHDLFKDLYMNIMPDKVRHCLGEFYTAPWLADSVIKSALNHIKSTNKTWKVLDPCGGSGTFITCAISKIIKECKESTSNEEKLAEILKRVNAIDLNPLAVLTLRINYFINISQFIDENTEGFEIPVYLGDAAAVPESIYIDDIECINYTIKTLKKDIEIKLPVSIISDIKIFSNTMNSLEFYVSCCDFDSVYENIVNLIPVHERKDTILDNVKELSNTLIDLQVNKWDGIWVRIIKNYLITANIGKFDIVVGNPPWVDWKSLPSNYRDKIKKTVCIDNELFSGAYRTGGINLNICALISNVVANKWLKSDGTLAVLMPKSLIHQPSYEGFRKFKLKNGKRLYLQELYDWTKAGHPFDPVKEKFLTYVYNSNVKAKNDAINVIRYSLKRGHSLDKFKNVQEISQIESNFKIEKLYAGESHRDLTTISYANKKEDLEKFQLITGENSYKGREGIEFYPQEIFLLSLEDMPEKDRCLFLKNYQNKRSKYKVPVRIIKIEKEYLNPLVRGREIEKYHLQNNKYCVPFPYEENEKIPMPLKELNRKAPSLAKYLLSSKGIIKEQTEYSEKIINDSNAEFYALARVGKYTYANYAVAYRDNTKWQATVVERIDTSWGNGIRPLFQNHAVSITQDKDGIFISREEAYYICGILNAPIVEEYIINSSDSRTFKIDPAIYIPKFDINNEKHKKIYELSKKAHENYDNKEFIKEIDEKIDKLYLDICKLKNNK